MAITISNVDLGSRVHTHLRKIRSITFTGTNGTSAATPDEIFGRILWLETSGGDAAWDATITNEAGATVFQKTGLTTAATRTPALIAGTNSDVHPAVAGKIKCVIANADAEAVVKVIYEEP